MPSISERILAGASADEIEDHFKDEKVTVYTINRTEKANDFLNGNKMDIIAWGALYKNDCSDDILYIMCTKCPSDKKIDGRYRKHSIPEVLITTERFGVMERLLKAKKYLLTFKMKELDVTLEHYITRLKDKDTVRKLLKAGRSRSLDEHKAQTYGDASIMLKDPKSFDMFVLIGEEKVGFHKVCATERSTYFAGLFGNNMIEARSSQITLEQDVSVGTVEWIREVMYKGSSDLPTLPSNVVEALQTAGYLGIEFIAIGLTKHIESEITLDNFWSLVNVAYVLDCEPLLQVLQDYLENHRSLQPQRNLEYLLHPDAMEYSKAFVYFVREATK